jgi:hypothetical protein
MKNLFLLSALIINITSCNGVLTSSKEGRNKLSRLNGFRSANVKPYVDYFESQYNYHTGQTADTSNITIVIGETKDDALGECWYKTKTIIIDKNKWPNLNEWERYALISHELGHCYLNRDHRDEVTSYNRGSRPISLMHPNILPSYIYQQYENSYNKELYNYSNISFGIELLGNDLSDIVNHIENERFDNIDQEVHDDSQIKHELYTENEELRKFKCKKYTKDSKS